MGAGKRLRILAALAVAAAGLFLATRFGASGGAALIVFAAAAIATALILIAGGDENAAAPAPEASGLPPLPDAAELLNATDQPMLIVRERRVLLANQAARAVLGQHIEGVDVRLAIRHPAAAERLAERPADTARKTDRIELVGLGERDRRWEMVTTTLTDGSRLVRLTDRSEAHASEQMRVDFVANASHELRTPLATLIGFSETLMDEAAGKDPETRSRFLKIMLDEARRMQQLVDDLMSLSRIEAERFSPLCDVVDLLSLVDEVRTGCAQLIEERQSGIEVEPNGVRPTVLGDRSQLLQMIRNLVINALKYGRSGEPVTVRFEMSGPEMVGMSVIDRGEGIAAEHLPRLTERFYRVDPGRSRAMGGTGLGLAIVKHIVGRHRGRLDIVSRPGQGTEVRVDLPLAPPVLSSKSHGTVTEPTRNHPTDEANLG